MHAAMSSSRPDTSVRQTAQNTSPAANGRQGYQPNVLDLLIPFRYMKHKLRLDVPPTFLDNETVDCSVKVGEGASFVVTRHAVPAGPEFDLEFEDMGDWSVTKRSPARPRPPFVAYKTARIRFDEIGKPVDFQDQRALQSVLTECYTLLHPPILEHANVIDFLGFAWSSGPSDLAQSLPALVVEYGDKGTLADVQLGNPILNLELKRSICHGIASGLEAIHAAGIVHGDLKPENIIMFSDPELGLRPKLADFGFSLVAASESSTIWIGGTRLWAAPEAFAVVPISQATATDVFSLGLLIWSIAIDGRSPFDVLIPATLNKEERQEKMIQLKQNDTLLELSRLQSWIVQWLLLSQNKELLSRIPPGVLQLFGGPQEGLSRLASVAHSNMTPSEDVPPDHIKKVIQLLSVRVCDQFQKQILFKDLEAIFAATLQVNPVKRSLQRVFQILSGMYVDTAPGATESAKRLEDVSGTINDAVLAMPSEPAVGPAATAPRTRTEWAQIGFKRNLLSWQEIRVLQPRQQRFVVGCLLKREDSPSKFVSAGCLLNGYGTSIDVSRAIENLKQAATLGNASAQTNIWRFCQSCDVDLRANFDIKLLLSKHAYDGSRVALQDLRAVDEAAAGRIELDLRWGYAGNGAGWYLPAQWHYELNQNVVLEKDFADTLTSPASQLTTTVVNERGDYLLHAAAAIGAGHVVEVLIDKLSVNVDKTNLHGETAILCACRSGHADLVKILLDRGASAAIQANNGESPLHWLSSFDKARNIAAIGQDLVDRGHAVVDACTNRAISHSRYLSGIDVEFQVWGTPLLWAVHNNHIAAVEFLLRAGAVPDERHAESPLTPLECAAYYHHTECLKAMIEHMEQHGLPNTPGQNHPSGAPKYVVIFGPLVREAIHSSDRFSMILRNGHRYKNDLKSTLAYLQEKTRLIKFRVGLHDTPLHFAAAEAHDDACEVLIELGWQIEDINTPAGPSKRTPIMEAVRWNRAHLFQLFLENGADPLIPCQGPFEIDENRSWTALHVYADQGHDSESELFLELIKLEIPTDGGNQQDNADQIETPLSVAIRRNGFPLANALRSHGASLETSAVKFGMLRASQSLSILGQLIALNSRNGSAALRYTLEHGAEYIVEKARKLTALHYCAQMPSDLSYNALTTPDSKHRPELQRKDFDFEINRGICREVLEWFHEPEQLDKLNDKGQTALHLATEHGNIGVVLELVTFNADKNLVSTEGETAADIARRCWESQPEVLKPLLQALN